MGCKRVWESTRNRPTSKGQKGHEPADLRILSNCNILRNYADLPCIQNKRGLGKGRQLPSLLIKSETTSLIIVIMYVVVVLYFLQVVEVAR